MADLAAWQASAEARLKRYQEDRGATASDRRGTGRLRQAIRDERGAGKELTRLADQVPPL